MKFIVAAVAAFLLIGQIVWAADAVPTKPTPEGSASWDYKILGFIFKGLEKSLQDAGLQFDVCSYVSYQTQTTTSANGMGECLYQNFKEGITNKGDVGITYIWVKTANQETLPIRVDWRPAQEGLIKIARELLTLKFEGIAHWWTDKVSKNPTEEKALPYSQNVLGRLRLTFPAGTRLADFIPSQQELLQGVEMAKEIEFSLTPLYKVDGYANYRGILSVTQEVQTPDENGQWNLDFKTNMNFLKVSRKFQIKGKFGSELEEEP
jgi:hypothetical protein